MSLATKISSNKVVAIAYSGLMTAVVFLATIVISLYIPATQGFFNIGEFGVYLAALTGGPLVGLIAGGLGSALADIFLGYTHYAPITLVVKGLEGFIVGYLAMKLRKSNIGTGVGVAVATLAGLSMAVIGGNFYIGEAEISILGSLTTVSISHLIWMVAAGVFIAVSLFIIPRKPERTGEVIAMLIGGSEMILGYFTAQYILFGAAAYVELFYNLMQVLIGMTLAIIVYDYLERMMP